MSEGHIHQYAQQVLRERFEELHWTVEEEVTVQNRSATLFGDLVAFKDGHSVLVEIENSPRRVESDLIKGSHYDFLWIVTPNATVRNAIKTRLTQLNVPEHYPYLSVMTLPAALTSASQLEALLFL